MTINEYIKEFGIAQNSSILKDAEFWGFNPEEDQFLEAEIGYCQVCEEWFFGHEECPCIITQDNNNDCQSN